MHMNKGIALVLTPIVFVTIVIISFAIAFGAVMFLAFNPLVALGLVGLLAAIVLGILLLFDQLDLFLFLFLPVFLCQTLKQSNQQTVELA